MNLQEFLAGGGLLTNSMSVYVCRGDGTAQAKVTVVKASRSGKNITIRYDHGHEREFVNGREQSSASKWYRDYLDFDVAKHEFRKAEREFARKVQAEMLKIRDEFNDGYYSRNPDRDSLARLIAKVEGHLQAAKTLLAAE